MSHSAAVRYLRDYVAIPSVNPMGRTDINPAWLGEERYALCVQQQLQKELVRALPSLRTLPSNVEAIATQLRRGRLTMRVERFAGADRDVVDEWVDRIVFAAMGVFGMIASGVLLAAAALVQSDDDFATALQVIGFFGVIVTAVIQMRVVAQILRRGDAEGRRRV